MSTTVDGFLLAPGCQCCTMPTCDICEDDFNRSDENPVTGDWSLESGEWEVKDNYLQNVSEGNLITTCRQSAPPDSSNYAITMKFVLRGSGPWKVICRYASESDYDYIRFVLGSGEITPEFYKNGVKVMDRLTHPGGAGWTYFSDTPLAVTICYSSFEWSTEPDLGSGLEWVYCAGSPETSLPTGLGLVGFRLGDFDSFDYDVHYESDRSCPACQCFCYDDDDDHKCIPETLTLELVPITFHPACGATGTTLTWTLTQTQSSATPFQLSPRKYEWLSPSFSSQDGADYWWRLICHDGSAMELVCHVYGSRFLTHPGPSAQFVTLDGPTGGAYTTDVDCLPTILYTFPNWRKNTLNIGSGGPPYCSPFPDILYTVKVKE